MARPCEKRVLAEWIRDHPADLLQHKTVQEWVHAEAGVDVQQYAARQAVPRGRWGGALELAAAVKLYPVTVRVWQRQGPGYRRMAVFRPSPPLSATPLIDLVFQGGTHYDVLKLTASDSTPLASPTPPPKRARGPPTQTPLTQFSFSRSSGGACSR